MNFKFQSQTIDLYNTVKQEWYIVLLEWYIKNVSFQNYVDPYIFGPLNISKTVDEWHKISKSTSKPRTSSSPAGYPYKVKYRCKFCEMLWLDKLALFSQILAIFLLFLP